MRRIDRAVVVGGSVAGLLAARVLAEVAERVTVLEGDDLPDAPTPRRGVPQATHQHALLPGGLDAIESLLPGFTADLDDAGAPRVDLAADVAWLSPFGWMARFASDLKLFTCSRSLLEWTVRQRVSAIANVEIRSGVRVTGLDQFDADVVVDAAGRASRAPAWLEAAGYQRPPETIIDADLAYSSQLVDAPLDAVPGARGVVIGPGPGYPRGGVAFPREDGRWLVTLVGTGGDHPPRDQAGFDAFARSIREPAIANVLASGTPAGPITSFRSTANRYRHYERVAVPAGFVSIGDAACAFNPVYAQGMSAAAMSAVALQRTLADVTSPAQLSRRYPRALAKAIKAPWMMATAADVTVAGIRPSAATRIVNRYVARVMAASTASVTARRALLDVMTLRRPPQTLFAPGVAAAALRHATTASPSAKVVLQHA